MDDLRLLLEHVVDTDVLVLLQTAKVLERPWVILELYTAITNGVPIVALNIQNAFPYDFAQAVDFLENLEQRLEAANPGALKLLKDNEVDPEDAAYRLSNTIPNVISISFDPKASNNAIKASLLDLKSAMGRATAVSIRMTKEKWLANRAARSASPEDSMDAVRWPRVFHFLMRALLLTLTGASVTYAFKWPGHFPLFVSFGLICPTIQLLLEFPESLRIDQSIFQILVRNSNAASSRSVSNPGQISKAARPAGAYIPRGPSGIIKRFRRHVNGWYFISCNVCVIGRVKFISSNDASSEKTPMIALTVAVTYYIFFISMPVSSGACESWMEREIAKCSHDYPPLSSSTFPLPLTVSKRVALPTIQTRPRCPC